MPTSAYAASFFSSKIRQRTNVIDPVADLGQGGTFMVRLLWAYMRRGFACEHAGLVSHETSELMRARVLRMRTDPPPDSRYTTPSIVQPQAFDRKVWDRLAENTEGT